MASVSIVPSYEARQRGITEENGPYEGPTKYRRGSREGDLFRVTFGQDAIQLDDYEITRDDGSKFMLRFQGKDGIASAVLRDEMRTQVAAELRSDITLEAISECKLYKYAIMDSESGDWFTIYADSDDLISADPENLNMVANQLLSEKRLSAKQRAAESQGLQGVAYVGCVGEYDGNLRKMVQVGDMSAVKIIAESERIRTSSDQIKNVQEYPQNIKKAAEMVAIGGHGFAHVEGYARLGRMHASTWIGSEANRAQGRKQEDAFALMVHPDIDDFRMMVVADGMGGHESGEIASSLAIEKTKTWFETLTEEDYSMDPELFKGKMQQAIVDIGNEVDKAMGDIQEKTEGDTKGGTTFVGAVTCKSGTVVANIGDSRAYIIENGELKQVTTDMSVVQRMYELGEIEQKDDMRFHKNSNMITGSMGMKAEIEGTGEYVPVTPYVNVVPRGVPLLLFSDGVTDCLSDKEILAITKNTNISALAETLTHEARTGKDSEAREGLDPEVYANRIRKGKDNTTAVVFADPGSDGR